MPGGQYARGPASPPPAGQRGVRMTEDDDKSLEATLDRLEDVTSGETISVGDLLDAFEHRGFGPVLLILALVCMLPTGAIPGVASGTALVIVAMALQIVAGRRHPWVPRRVASMSLRRDAVLKALKTARPTARRIDRALATRLKFLTHHVANAIVALVICALAISIVPLQVIPFAAALPALVIAVFALGITARDGVLTVVGLAATCALAAFAAQANVF